MKSKNDLRDFVTRPPLPPPPPPHYRSPAGIAPAALSALVNRRVVLITHLKFLRFRMYIIIGNLHLKYMKKRNHALTLKVKSKFFKNIIVNYINYLIIRTCLVEL